MSVVYALGALKINFNSLKNVQSHRLWALYSDFDIAEKAVLENRGDLFEDYYNYALIEEVCVLPKKDEWFDFPPKQWWYKVEYNINAESDTESKPSVFKIDVPKEFENVCYWWVG